MKKVFLALVLSLYAQAASAATIATGPSDGSYFQIAQDIKNVAGKDGIDIQVMATKGSVENIELLAVCGESLFVRVAVGSRHWGGSLARLDEA